MADPVLTFSPKVRELVSDALKNNTKIAMLQPQFYATEPNKQFSKYDQSEFFQLRLACAVGLADQVAKIYDIGKAESDRVCDAVLVTAADQMRKGVAVDDPTHLLAPYLLSQRGRGYTAADGPDFQIAMRAARLTANANRNVKGNAPQLDTSDQPVQVNATEAIAPEARPKANPNVQFNINTTKGGAKDAAFTSNAAHFVFLKGSVPLEGRTFTIADPIINPAAKECNSKGSSAGRSECTDNGFGLANVYNHSTRSR